MNENCLELFEFEWRQIPFIWYSNCISCSVGQECILVCFFLKTSLKQVSTNISSKTCHLKPILCGLLGKRILSDYIMTVTLHLIEDFHILKFKHYVNLRKCRKYILSNVSVSQTALKYKERFGLIGVQLYLKNRSEILLVFFR
jgi:hypothetical protein